LAKAIEDFKGNEAYGRATFHPIDTTDTIDAMRRSIEAMGANRPDILVIDYLGLVPGLHRGTRREEMAATVRAAKRTAENIFNGEGILIWAAYQTNRAGHERALDLGYYDLHALEETAEAEKSTDVILWLLRTPECVENNELKVGIMKSRDSDRLQEDYLYCDFATCLVSNLRDTT
ncbi:unnamed protein product, partial [marine sediment metagenome]